MSKVYIVLVNYKKYEDTIECLESITKSNFKNYQVLLIDNSPDDSSINNIKKWFNGQYGDIKTLHPDLVYPLNNRPIMYKELSENQLADSADIYNQQFIAIRADNRGFAAANNIALNYLINNGEEQSFVWILNNDTVICKNTIDNLLAYYSNNNNQDKLIGGKLMYYDKKDYLQAIAANYNKWLGSTKHIGDGELDEGQYDNYEITNTNYIIGACMFLPIKYLKQLGLMNEEYFLFYEELDWLLKASKYNLDFDIQPSAKVYHKESSTIRENKNMDTADYYSIVNRLKFTKKWYPGYFFSVGLGVVYALGKRLLKRRFSFVYKTCKAVLSVVFG